MYALLSYVYQAMISIHKGFQCLGHRRKEGYCNKNIACEINAIKKKNATEFTDINRLPRKLSVNDEYSASQVIFDL